MAAKIPNSLNVVGVVDSPSLYTDQDKLWALENHLKAVTSEIKIQYCNGWVFKVNICTIKLDHVEGLQCMFGFGFGFGSGSPPWQCTTLRRKWQFN